MCFILLIWTKKQMSGYFVRNDSLVLLALLLLFCLFNHFSWVSATKGFPLILLFLVSEDYLDCVVETNSLFLVVLKKKKQSVLCYLRLCLLISCHNTVQRNEFIVILNAQRHLSSFLNGDLPPLPPQMHNNRNKSERQEAERKIFEHRY